MTEIILISGTGTGIGKTFLACATLHALSRRGQRGLGVKPVESGGREDVDALEQASTFHVTRSTPPYLLKTPVSPHLAARLDGVTIDIDVICRWVSSCLETKPDVLVVELPGGLFSPLTDAGLTNADLTRALNPHRTWVVTPNRLGALHDVLATVAGASMKGVRIDDVVLSTPTTPDLASDSNADELRRLLPTIGIHVLLRTNLEGATNVAAALLDGS